jgi:hypothetical protein
VLGASGQFAALAPFFLDGKIREMSVRGLPQDGSVRVRVNFTKRTFIQIEAAAQQTNLPVSSFLKEVIEADLATRRLNSPALPSAKT